MTKTINIQTDISDMCTGYDTGNKLHSLIADLLDKGCAVQVDLSGVKFTSQSFYNGAVGKLVLDYDISTLKERVQFLSLSSTDKFFLSRTINLAKKVKSEGIRDTQDSPEVPAIHA